MSLANEFLDVPASSTIERELLADEASAAPNKPSIGPVQPSALLGRLQDFLPKLQASNAQLPTDGSAVADVAVALGGDEGAERPAEGEASGRAVQLDLACGIFDVEDERTYEAAKRATGGEAVDLKEAAQEVTDDVLMPHGASLGAPLLGEASPGADMQETKTVRRKRTQRE